MTVGADGLATEVSPPSPVVDDVQSSSPTQPVATGEITTTPETTTPPTPPVEDSPRDPRPRDQFGRFAEKREDEPDPVKEALDKLAGKAKSEVLPAKDAKSASPPVAAPPQQATEKPASDPKAASPDALTTDPFTDYNDNERAAIRDKTKNRIETLHQRWLQSDAKLKEAEPLVAAGKEYTELIENFGVRDDVGFVPPDHMAGLIRVQAGINRAQIALQEGRAPAPTDIQALDLLTENVTRLRQQFGLSPAATTSTAIEPLKGELPPDLRDLVEVYGLDETDVRLLAAIKAKPAARAPSPAPAPAPIPVPTAQPQASQSETAYRGLLNRTLAAEGAKPEAVTELMEGARAKLMRQFAVDAPTAAALFNDMSPKDRFDMLMEARKGSTKPSTPPPATRLPPPTTQRTITGPAPKVVAAPLDPVESAIARMTQG